MERHYIHDRVHDVEEVPPNGRRGEPLLTIVFSRWSAGATTLPSAIDRQRRIDVRICLVHVSVSGK